MGILEAFIPFVLFLGLIIPPIAAIYVIDSWTRFRSTDPAGSLLHLPAYRWYALGTWAASILVGALAAYGDVTLTTVPALDATLFGGSLYALLTCRRRRT
jgi:cytosine permease